MRFLKTTKKDVDNEEVNAKLAELQCEIDHIGKEPVTKEFRRLLTDLLGDITFSEKILMEKFATMLFAILVQETNFKTYDPSYRSIFVKSLMALCNKNCVNPISVYEALLPLTVIDDKELRITIQNFIVSDIRKRNVKLTPVELNKKTKIILQKWIDGRKDKLAIVGVRILIHLFKKNIWTDELCVNILAESCLHNSAKVKVAALTFFLNKTKSIEKDSDSDSETEVSIQNKKRKALLAFRVGKKSQARKKHMDKEINNLKKKRKKKDKPDSLFLECNVLAIQLIRDPQRFAENMFSKMKKAPMHIRLLMLEFLARLIGYYKLQIVDYYSYMTPFLNPRTTDVTNLLVYVAQSSHEMVSPDDIQPVVKMVANQFVNEGVSGQGITVGLNCIREICARCPHAMPDDLLPLLVEYKTYRDKNVVSATRSLVRLFREINPDLLPKFDRGKPTEASVDAVVQGEVSKLPKAFGELNSVSFIPGAEVIKELTKEEAEDEEYESCSDISDESDDDGEWVDIIHSDEESTEQIRDPKERKQRAEKMSYDHIFTDEELLAIKKHQVTKLEQPAKKGSRQKQKQETMEIDSDTGEIIDPNAPCEFVTEGIITKMSKKAKESKEERMKSIEDGRVDRLKYGFSVNRLNPNSSTTNREKSKRKNFMMVRHKKKEKQQKLSLKQKNKLFREHLMKKAKFMRS